MAIIKPNNNTLSAITALPANVGDFNKISQTITTSSASIVEFTGLDFTTYSNYYFTFSNVEFASGGNFISQVGTSSGYLSSDYGGARYADMGDRTTGLSSSHFELSGSVSNSLSGWCIISPADSTMASGEDMFSMVGQFIQRSAGDRMCFLQTQNTNSQGTGVTKIKFFNSSSNTFTDGATITMYGMK